MIVFIKIDDQEGQRSDETGSHGNGNTAEVAAGTRLLGDGGEAVEAGESHRATDKIDEGDGPADVSQREKNSPREQHGRSHSERNDIRKRIELAAEGRILPAEPGKAAVQQIEEAGAENQQDGVFIVAPRDFIVFLCRQDGLAGDALHLDLAFENH